MRSNHISAPYPARMDGSPQMIRSKHTLEKNNKTCHLYAHTTAKQISQHFLQSFVYLTNFIYSWPLFERTNNLADRERERKKRNNNSNVGVLIHEHLQTHSIWLRKKSRHNRSRRWSWLCTTFRLINYSKSSPFFGCKNRMLWHDCACRVCADARWWLAYSTRSSARGERQKWKINCDLFIRVYLIFHIFRIEFNFAPSEIGNVWWVCVRVSDSLAHRQMVHWKPPIKHK